jgi:cytochrome c553
MRNYFIFLITIFLLIGCEKKEENKSEVIQDASPKINIVENAMDITTQNPLIVRDIDGNEKINISSDDNEEIQIVRKITAYAYIRNNYEKVSKELLSKKLSKNYFLKCSSCHDDYANGVIGPSLLTKTSDEIFDMIKAYKSDTKDNVLMRYLVSQMDDKEIRSLANEISEFNKEVREMNR